MDAITLPAHCWVFDRFGRLFISCWPLSWRSFCFRCVVVDPCFIHWHIPTQKILFTSFEQLQTALWILDALLFLVECEQTRYPLRKQLTYHQRFVQDCFLISLRWQLYHATLIYDCPKLFCGLLLCFSEQLLILGDQSVQRHWCLCDRV